MVKNRMAAAKKIETTDVRSSMSVNDAPQSETRIRVRRGEVVAAMADALEDILRAEGMNDWR